MGLFNNFSKGYKPTMDAAGRPYADGDLVWVNDYPATPAARDHDQEARRRGMSREALSEEQRQRRIEHDIAEYRKTSEYAEQKTKEARQHAQYEVLCREYQDRWYNEGRNAWRKGILARSLYEMAPDERPAGLDHMKAEHYRLAGYIDEMNSKDPSVGGSAPPDRQNEEKRR